MRRKTQWGEMGKIRKYDTSIRHGGTGSSVTDLTRNPSKICSCLAFHGINKEPSSKFQIPKTKGKKQRTKNKKQRTIHHCITALLHHNIKASQKIKLLKERHNHPGREKE